MMLKPACLGVLLLATPLWSQQQKPPPKVDDAKVNEAIKRGVQFLRAKADKKPGVAPNTKELVALALVHAGVPKTDPLLDSLLKVILEEDPATTYRVALQAMLLEQLDRAAYQKRIVQCAQFLVDNQCGTGQWSYGTPTTYPEPKPEPEIGAAEKYRVKKQRDGPNHGDHSNSLYAALGLRACHDSGILLPAEVVQKAAQNWRDTQTVTKGWSYGPKGNTAYGSMTAGAVGALTICDYLQGDDWTKDAAVNGGIDWLRDNFTVAENPGRHHQHHYYYLYGLERAGMLYGTEKIGKFDWYQEGARFLLADQLEDGSWEKKPIDTCFAILFLRRATRPLVASVDKK